MLSSAFFRSLIFGTRSGGKCVADEDATRGLICAGQVAKAGREGAKGTSIFARTLERTANLFNKWGENDKLMGRINKTVDFASKNVNPLIVIGSGIKILKSDDRQSEGIKQGGCLAGMFAMEGWMSKHLDPLIDKLPINKKWAPAVKGITFVAGSLTASGLGTKIGEKVAESFKEDKNKQSKHMQPYTKMVYAA